MSMRRRIARVAERWRDFPSEARRAYRLGGFGELGLLVADRSVHLLFRHDRMVVVAQTLDSIRETAIPKDVSITIAKREDMDSLSELASRSDIELFRTRLDAGGICLLAWRDGRPVGYTWISERMGPDVTICPLPLPPNAAYLYDLYVAPAERSSGIGSVLVVARLRWARERGFAEGWRMVSVKNHASLRTVEKTRGEGTRVVGEMSYVKILDRMYPRFMPVGAIGPR